MEHEGPRTAAIIMLAMSMTSHDLILDTTECRHDEYRGRAIRSAQYPATRSPQSQHP